MCGIGGIWSLSGARHRDLRRMMSAIAHRGPEGAAYAQLDRGALLFGFLRLGFTGGGTCQQPMFTDDGAIGLVFNGELYDHHPLRRELIGRGHSFHTESDTEVLLHLYAEHGERFYDLLNGELAFAIFDERSSELLLVRDRFGVKPLFYARHRGAFVFASECKAILALDGFPAELDPAYFTGPGVGLAECSMTPYRGISQVRPGHVLRVTRDGAMREQAYWQPSFDKIDRNMHDAAHELRAVLSNAVRRRLEGDPPIALSLSSGVDSTVIASLAARHGPIPAFSVGYDGASYDESAQAERTARHFGLPFHRVPISIDTLAEGLLETLHSIEVPTNNLSAVARVAMTRAVRKSGLKALMSGEGSDELFGGYPYFGAEAVARVPDKNMRSRAWERFGAHEGASRGIFWDELHGASSLFGYPSAYQQRIDRVSRDMRRLFSRDFLRSMGTTPHATASRELDFDRLRTLAPFDATRVIARSILGALIIPGLGDRVEMSSSLEGRVPYLDRDVVELAYSLREEHCVDARGLNRKLVLRHAFADRLPPRFAPPAKTTRMAPSFADLMGSRRGRELVETFTSDRAVRDAGIFDPMFVRALRPIWKLWPRGGRRHAQLDFIMGYVLCTHALRAVIVSDALGKRMVPRLLALDENRTPQRALRKAQGGAR